VDNDISFNSPEINVSGLTNTSYTPTTPLTANTWYYWRVEAVDGQNNHSGFSLPRSLYISPGQTQDTTPPPVPALMSPADGSSTANPTPTFTWGSVSDPSGVTYSLQVDNDISFNSPEINVSGLTNTSYTPTTPLTANTWYYWRVEAVDGKGNRSGFSLPRSLYISPGQTQDTTPPPVPALISPPDGSSTTNPTPTFTWGSVSDPSGVTYSLQVDNDINFNSPEINVSGLTNTSYTPTTPLTANTWYYWRVEAVDGQNNHSGWSGERKIFISLPSPTTSLKLYPPSPNVLDLNTIHTNKVLLKYAVPATDEVELKIYNIAGELVATLINSVKSKGEYNAYWDGKNLMHEYVSPGVYFVYLKVGDTVKIEKIVVIK
jgi:hypothetical protein